jgi:hypothetical protein
VRSTRRRRLAQGRSLHGGARHGSGGTRLIKTSYTYRDAATGRSVDVGSEDVVVVTGAVPSVEVARERFRVVAVEDLTSARAAAENGEHAEAARILDWRQEALAAWGSPATRVVSHRWRSCAS